jgi:hypothetical protein
MSQYVIYVGIDVDDVRYHGSALDQCAGEVLNFHPQRPKNYSAVALQTPPRGPQKVRTH